MRKRWMVFFLIVMLALALMACGQAADPDPVDPDEPDDPVDEPTETKRFGIAWTEGIVRVDPNVSSRSRHARQLIVQFAEPLVHQVGPGEFKPGIASMEHNEEMTWFQFTVREGLTFPDGNPINAEVLEYMVEYTINPDADSPDAERFNDMKRHGAVSEYVWEIEFNNPYYRFLDTVANSTTMSPNSPAAIEDLGGAAAARAAEYGREPVTYGPYMISHWEDDQTLILAKNPDWVRADWMGPEYDPYYDEIEIALIDERTTALAAYETGDLQAIYEPPFIGLRGLEDSPDHIVHKFFTHGATRSLHLNVTRFPTSDLYMRRAMNHAFSRQELVDIAFEGLKQTAYGPLARGSWAYWPEVENYYPYDPDKAREVLEEGGWELNPSTGFYELDGRDDAARMVIGVDGEQYAYVTQKWNEAGIRTDLQTVEFAASTDAWDRNDYEIATIGLMNYDPDLAFEPTLGGNDEPNRFNLSRVRDDQVDELLFEGRTTTDIDTRIEIYTEIQRIVMEQAWQAPMYENMAVWVHPTTFTGLKFNSFDCAMFNTIRPD